MRILSLTILQEKKLKEMILKLFPEYNYVVIRKNGIVSLSKSFWWSLIKRPKTLHVSEMCSVLIPEKLQTLYMGVFENDHKPYDPVYNQYSHIVLDLLHCRSNKVVDYLYDEFILIKYGLRKAHCVKNDILPQAVYTLSKLLSIPIKKDSIVLSKFSNAYAKQSLKHWKKSISVLNHPILLSNSLNMWFRKEVKEYLKQYYQIKISIV